MKSLRDRFFDDAPKIGTMNEPATHRSYREFLAFFRRRRRLTEHDVVIGAYFTYGWMPTILDLRGDLAEVVTIANAVKKGHLITEEQVKTVALAINNSVVGASKFLHFIDPERHAIWDSRVYRYLHQKHPYQYRLETPGAYNEYRECLEDIAKDVRFPATKEKVEKVVGYKVTDKRAAELVMFHNGQE